MKQKLTWKIWLLIIILVLSFLSIFGMPPTFSQKGVLIKSVESNSTAFEQGLRSGQVIISIDSKKVDSFEDFTKIIQEKFPSEEKIKTTIKIKQEEFILYDNQTPQIIVSDIPLTNLKMGLDLVGGSRALVQAQEKKLSTAEITELVDVIRNRLNVYGIADMNIRPVSDLSGNNFMLIEIAGATPTDIEELISEQGIFEARIGNETVFTGGEKDIS
ncbi:MAG: PDZ domain-containing protein, partial [Nanoarchaeota archaeon]|nr:PDZ domain-containing protein [Nanoarchaeota archaeon]